ncbi:MAG TPA: hypothetical protein VMZ28_22735, partial [Kofleriaceae bacterium]|nr:hypothetical protein [Kofleriaceae bacterium]
RVDGPAARYTVALTSVAPATVSLRGAAVKSGAAVELPAGAMLEVKRTGSAPPQGPTPPDGDDGYTLTVTPAR